MTEFRDWKNIYLDQCRTSTRTSYRDIVNKRLLRFRVHLGHTDNHVSEIEFLIANHDYSKALLKRYEPIISEECKNRWLDKFYENQKIIDEPHHRLHTALIPFYLINPKTNNKRIDKQFLDDQILISSSNLDHSIKKHRWRAFYQMDFILIGFKNLNPTVRIQLASNLSHHSTPESIQKLNQFYYKHYNILPQELIIDFVEEQLSKGIVTNKMSIGYLKRFINMIPSNTIDKLRTNISKLADSKKILRMMKSS